ncbi:hypothetical protein BDZ97DRAFT_1343702 [Flammula alnicola]|nr:hypothetical protein BDZ97DRAFT_1343702 [Flammula alnicola]
MGFSEDVQGEDQAQCTFAPSSSPAGSLNSSRVANINRPHTSAGISNAAQQADRIGKTLQIDLWLSTTGMLDGLPTLSSPPSLSPRPPRVLVNEAMLGTNAHWHNNTNNNNTLAPPPTSAWTTVAAHRAASENNKAAELPARRGAELHVAGIPENLTVVTGVVVAHDKEDQPGRPGQVERVATPSSVLDHKQYINREEDRARDVYMTCLKDMKDLGIMLGLELELTEEGRSAATGSSRIQWYGHGDCGWRKNGKLVKAMSRLAADECVLVRRRVFLVHKVVPPRPNSVSTNFDWGCLVMI